MEEQLLNQLGQLNTTVLLCTIGIVTSLIAFIISLMMMLDNDTLKALVVLSVSLVIAVISIAKIGPALAKGEYISKRLIKEGINISINKPANKLDSLLINQK